MTSLRTSAPTASSTTVTHNLSNFARRLLWIPSSSFIISPCSAASFHKSSGSIDLKNAYSDLHRNVPPLKVVQHNQKASTANKESVVDVTSTGAEYYTIKKGDTLSKIAVRHHTTVAKLCKLNNLKSTSIIRLLGSGRKRLQRQFQ